MCSSDLHGGCTGVWSWRCGGCGGEDVEGGEHAGRDGPLGDVGGDGGDVDGGGDEGACRRVVDQDLHDGGHRDCNSRRVGAKHLRERVSLGLRWKCGLVM